MLWFSQRLELTTHFSKWCDELGARKNPLNMVAFLMSEGLLDTDKTMAYLKEKEDKNELDSCK